MTKCHVCDNDSVLTINGTETCSEHFDATMYLLVDMMALERGIPIKDARQAIAKLVFEALGQSEREQ